MTLRGVCRLAVGTQLATGVMLGALAFVGPVPAAERDDRERSAETANGQDPIQIEEVIVSATRTRESTRAVPGSPTIITSVDVEQTPFRGGHQVDDLLRYVPGVQPSNLSSRYNHPTAQAVSVRGLGNRRALVLLDGIPLNDGFGGWINWGMTPDNIDRIEVVPGGGSNLYGTWAMGGVIQLLTRPAPAGAGLSLEASAGNLDTYTTSLWGGYGADRAGITLGYRWYHTNGFVTVPESQRGPVDQNNDSRHELFSGSLALALTPRVHLTVGGNFFHEDRNFGTRLRLATRTIGTASAGLAGRTPRGDDWETKVFAQWQTFRNKTSQVVPSPTLRLSEVRDAIQTIPSNDFGGHAVWAATISPRHRLVLGGDARAILGQSEEQLFSMGNPSGRALAKGKQVGGGLFAEWIAEPTENLVVIPSFRGDWWKNFDASIESTSGTTTLPPDNVETALNPKLAVRYRLLDRLTVGASAYRAFRAPTLNELYRGFSFGGFSFLPNPTLSPERLWGADATMQIGLLTDQRLTVRATGHYGEVEDQILFVAGGPTFVRRENVGRTRTIGAEVDLRFQAHRWAAINIGYAYADSIIASFPPDPSLEHNRIPDVSRHQVVVGVTVGQPKVVQLTVLGRYLSRQFADVQNAQPIADFVVLDASLRRSLGQYVRLFLDAENLTDRRYIATQTGPIKTLGAPRLVVGGIRLSY